MTLGFSRRRFCKVVWNSSSQSWCALHEEAFAYFGGAARLIRLDNLREGVIDPDIYDPELNALYAEMLAHYRVVAIPCRPYAPDLKGKVESAVGHTQGTALKGRTFENIEEQNCPWVCGFEVPAEVSPKAAKSIRQTMRSWSLHRRSDLSLDDIARRVNPVIRGWINYYGR